MSRVQADDEKWEAREGVSPQRLPNLATYRSHLAAVVVPRTNAVLVVGGARDEGQEVLNTTEMLEPGANAWQPGPTFPTARKGCGACVVGDEVIVVGGATSNGVPCNIVEAVNIDSGAHRTLPPLPNAAFTCGVVSVQGLVIVTGGEQENRRCTDKVWALDVGYRASPQQQGEQPAWVALPSMRDERGYHGVAAGDDRVFVLGGAPYAPRSDCEALTIRGGKAHGPWKKLPELPMASCGDGLITPACCYGGGNLFVVGGASTYFPVHREVYALDLSKKKWTEVTMLRFSRDRSAAVCVGRRVLILGGETLCRDNPACVCEALQF